MVNCFNASERVKGSNWFGPKPSKYSFWKTPKVLYHLIRKYSCGVRGNDLIDWLNTDYDMDYEYSSYSAILNDEVFKVKLREYEDKLSKRVSEEIIDIESKSIAPVIVNSKDVLRAAVNTMGSLLGKIDRTDERDTELVRNRKLKYGDYARIMRELRDTIRLLNELEGSGESITVDDILARFKRKGSGELMSDEESVDRVINVSEKVKSKKNIKTVVDSRDCRGVNDGFFEPID